MKSIYNYLREQSSEIMTRKSRTRKHAKHNNGAHTEEDKTTRSSIELNTRVSRSQNEMRSPSAKMDNPNRGTVLLRGPR
jgi:hypothetical protein